MHITIDLDDTARAATILTALAGDQQADPVTLRFHDGSTRVGDFVDADEQAVRIQDESGDQPFGESHEWCNLAAVNLA